MKTQRLGKFFSLRLVTLYAAFPLASLGATATAPSRSPQDILQELQATSAEVQQTMGSFKVLFDATKRVQMAPKLIPLLKKANGLMEELAAATGDQSILEQPSEVQSILVMLGDPETIKGLETATAGKDERASVDAQLVLAMGSWLKGKGDVAAQDKVLDGLEKLVKTHENDDELAQTLLMMEKMGSTNATLAKRAHDIVLKDSKADAAQKLRAQPAVNAPLAFSGETVEGKQFSTSDFKGKVILVDFWATWCGPCKAGLPEVKDVYAKYHDKGLEIVGVSCDQDGGALKQFTKDNDMPWSQLWDKSRQTNPQTSWHELATRYGVEGIPTMFLIDRNGVLRYVDAREHLEEKVKTLCEEKVGSSGK